jgi:hypothetical protein
MQQLKIERRASKIRRTQLKVTIDGAVADDLELMAQWSENDAGYLVNLLLRFAIGQSEDFQKYKESRAVDAVVATKAGSDAPDRTLGEDPAP